MVNLGLGERGDFVVRREALQSWKKKEIILKNLKIWRNRILKLRHTRKMKFQYSVQLKNLLRNEMTKFKVTSLIN
jgi:hypothetical protein